tara:strand:- start:447 stop:575 length:129 start_codon:yes stop_codon:yes gene_type:complete
VCTKDIVEDSVAEDSVEVVAEDSVEVVVEDSVEVVGLIHTYT